MMERGQLSMLRIILGLPTWAPSLAIHHLGTLPIELIMIKRSLSLLHSILSLPDSATPSKRLLIARCNSSPRKGFPCRIIKYLTDFSLPSILELSNSLPSKAAWKAHIKGLIYIHFYELLDDASAHMPSLSDVRIHSKLNGRLTCIVSSCRGDVAAARRINFRLRLLLHCAALNQDTAIFHSRFNRSRDPLCPLCHLAIEDSSHFISICPALQVTQDQSWVSIAISLLLHLTSQPMCLVLIGSLLSPSNNLYFYSFQIWKLNTHLYSFPNDLIIYN